MIEKLFSFVSSPSLHSFTFVIKKEEHGFSWDKFKKKKENKFNELTWVICPPLCKSLSQGMSWDKTLIYELHLMFTLYVCVCVRVYMCICVYTCTDRAI